MDGVGKQTDSIPCSIKRSVIKRVEKKGEAAPICWTTLLTVESLLEELKVW